MYTVRVKHFDVAHGESRWSTVSVTEDLEEARSNVWNLDLYYKQVQIVEQTTVENVIE